MIIVTYNGLRWIENCISSINEDYLELDIIVVDNASTDGTVEFIKKTFPFVRVIPQNVNLGFGGANNLGFEIAKKEGAEYIYLLNQDTVSYHNSVYKLIDIQKDIAKIGVVSPIHLNEKGTHLDPDFEGYITAGTCKDYISDFTLGKIKPYYELGFINAAAWLIKVETVEYLGGLFSKAFFHYGEDVNFIGRLRKFGFKNIIVPGVYVHHCREERIKGVSQEFQKKMIKINKVNIMHDIKNSYISCTKTIFKYAIQQLSLGNFRNFFELIFYPVLGCFNITKYRESYLKRKLD